MISIVFNHIKYLFYTVYTRSINYHIGHISWFIKYHIGQISQLNKLSI